MSRGTKLELVQGLTEDEKVLLRRRLDESNLAHVPQQNPSEINLSLRDEAGEIVAGLIGSVGWRWLHVNILWVSESLRGTGLGQQLMTDAEAIARERDCKYARLHTFDFQARPFYERLGYKVIGETPDFPEGHSQYLMVKNL